MRSMIDVNHESMQIRLIPALMNLLAVLDLLI